MMKNEARKLQKKIAKNQFGFDDFLSQIQQIKENGKYEGLSWHDTWGWESYERCRY
jgi:signal recognition particle GTPase